MKIRLIILAGGMATRVQPISNHIPKNLFPILGKPFVEYQFDIFRANGFFDLTFCLGHLGILVEEQVSTINKKYFGESFNITFLHDGPVNLGTGGAIAKSLSTFSGNFAVMYGDSYLTANLKSMVKHFYDNSEITQISVTNNVNSREHYNVKILDGMLLDIRKSLLGGNYAEYGFSVINRRRYEEFLSLRLQSDEPLNFDLIEFFTNELEARKLSFYETDHSFWEIGSFVGIDMFEKYMREKTDAKY